MFSGILKKVSKKINLRLSAVFSLLFIVGSLLLFGVIYVMLSSFILREDATALRLKMLELWVHYESGGLANLIQEVRENTRGREPFIIRVADSKGSTLFLHISDIFGEIDLEQFERELPAQHGKISRMRLKSPKRSLEASTIGLADGNILQVGIDVTNRERILKRVRSTFIISIIPLVLISFFTGSLIAARALRPISRLSTAVRSIIDTGKIEARIPQEASRDELGDLVSLFNRMLEKIETLVEGMKGTLDAVAHELKTPLTRLRGSAEMTLHAQSSIESCRESLGECIEESEHILTMLNTIMDIKEAETGVITLSKTELDISTLIRECVDLYSYVAEEKEVALHAAVPEEIMISADRGRIRRAVLNLLDNAIKYTHRGGKIEVSAVREKRFILISVCDNGTGIDNEELPHIWERLYRGREHSGNPGLGLGLSFVRAIVEAHGGDVSAESAVGKGSKFVIRLPK